MTHHLLPEIDRDVAGSVTNCFLIRDPAEVIASYTKKNHDPSLEGSGFVQQAEIFDFVRAETGLDATGDRRARCVGESAPHPHGSCAMRSASRLARRCCRGRQDCARPMASGRSIGMRKWSTRPPFGRLRRSRPRSPGTAPRRSRRAALEIYEHLCASIGCAERFGIPMLQNLRRDGIATC